MGKWGWMLISIGCIVIIYSATKTDFTQQMSTLVSGLLILVIGVIMSYVDNKKTKKTK